MNYLDHHNNVKFGEDDGAYDPKKIGEVKKKSVCDHISLKLFKE
jgi:hypothetical protein